MKRLALFICTLLCANVLLSQTYFRIDSLIYEITSTTPPTVEVYSVKYTPLVVNIPETATYESTTYSVTSIGSSAFYNCRSLTSVTIPNSVTSTSNPQPPSKNDIELKEKEATQKKRLKEVKISTRRHKIPLPHNAT